MESKIQIKSNTNLCSIKVNIRNTPLSIFYLIIAILWCLFVFWMESSIAQWLNNPVFILLVFGVLFVLFYLILKAAFGQAKIEITRETLTAFEGVFGIGRKIKFPTQEIDRIYVFRHESDGVSSENQPILRHVKQHITFMSKNRKRKFLHNQIATGDLRELCDVIVNERRKFIKENH
ncbi:MAG: hypothetical protein JXR03_09985 [Cyclobacteriaceae bacterium]